MAPGENIAIVGRSGGGKSTLVNLLPRFYDAKAGSVRIDGADVRDYELHSLREQIAVVSQDVVLFNDTVAANIAYGMSDRVPEAEIVAAARAAHALEFVDRLPLQVLGQRRIDGQCKTTPPQRQPSLVGAEPV